MDVDRESNGHYGFHIGPNVDWNPTRPSIWNPQMVQMVRDHRHGFDTAATHWDHSIMIVIMFTTQGTLFHVDAHAHSPQNLTNNKTLPVIIIWRFHMALHQRIGLIALMAVSLFTMVMSILKTIGIQTIANQQANSNAKDVVYHAPVLRFSTRFSNRPLSSSWAVCHPCVLQEGCHSFTI